MMKKFTVSLVLVAMFLSLFNVTAFAASDWEPPVLVDAFTTKAVFSKGENVELVLKFIEPGGIKLDGTSAYFALIGSISPNTTNVYTGGVPVNVCSFSDVTQTYCTAEEIGNGYYALLVGCPVSDGHKDYFMSGKFRFTSLMTEDLSNNCAAYGDATMWCGGGDPIPKTVEFTVDNPGADTTGPVVKSISISPTSAKAGENVNVKITAFDYDGISGAGLTFVRCNNYYQYYPSEPFAISDVDSNGISTLSATFQLPDTLGPGKYQIGQFGITDKRNNWNYNNSINPLIENLDSYFFEVTNDGYHEPVPPTIEEFSISNPYPVPGDNVTFKVKIRENGTEIQPDCYLRMISLSSNAYSQVGGANLTKGSDGCFTGTYRIPCNWTERLITFGMLIGYKQGGNYQPYFPDDDSDLAPFMVVGSVFAGLDDVVVMEGSENRDLLAGVTARNGWEGDMTSRIRIANPPDYAKPGIYFIRYEITSAESANPNENTYIGYRWVGITDVMPDSPDDPFVVAEDELTVGATSDDVSIQADIGDGGFRDIAFTGKLTQAGAYKFIKLKDDVSDSAYAGRIPARQVASGSRQLLGQIVDEVPNKYAIAFDPNGGAGEPMANKPMIRGVTRALPANTYTKGGYAFAGWATSPDGPTAYQDQARVKDLASAGTVTLYAKWVMAVPSPCRAASLSCTGIKVSWGAVSGVSGYEVYRAASKGGEYRLVYTAASAESSYVDKGLKTNVPYYYKVRAFISGQAAEYSGWTDIASAKPAPPKATITSASPTAYNAIRIAWKAVKGATKYELSRSASRSGGFRVLATTSALSYMNKGVETGKTYYYRVRAYKLVNGVKAYGSFSDVKPAKATLAAPAKAKAAKASARSVKITWGAVKGASGYEIYRSTAKNGNYSRIKATGARSYTDGKLTRGKAYYYKVRAYRLAGGRKVYGGFSPVVKAGP